MPPTMFEASLNARCGFCSSRASRTSGPRPFALPGTKSVYERPRPFKIEHIALDLELDFPARAIFGKASLDIERVDESAEEIALDAVGFELGEVTVSGEKVDVVYDGDTLRVPIGRGTRKATIVINYRATPRRGLYFLEADDHVRDRPSQVWSQCQDEDARFWFPCHDKPHIKQSFELKIKVPANWLALSNGKLVERSEGEGFAIYHYRMSDPLPSYLATLVAGEFSELDGGEVDGVKLRYFVPKGREEDGRRSFKRTAAMLEHFNRLTGIKYPWESYSQIVVHDFIFGGMENTTATTLYEHVLLDERAAIDITGDDLIAHELAHHWFGNYVTCRDFSHGWLNEGFATLFEHLDREAKGGKDEYEYYQKLYFDAYLTEANQHYKRPIVCRDYEEPIDIFDRHLYEKGGLVLHMLRVELGDDVFWRGVRLYLERHARSIVETRDLLRALEEVSGRSLEQFFELWVHSPGHPELAIKVEHEDGLLVIEVEQTQERGEGKEGETKVPLFAFNLVFEIAETDGTIRRETRRIEHAKETIVIPQRLRPRYIVSDPDFAVIADMSIEMPLDMLKNQLKEAKTARGRYLAIEPLGKRVDAPALLALGESLEDEDEYWGTRAMAAEALGAMRTDAAFEILERASKTQDPKARRAIVSALGNFKTEDAARALSKVALRDASYLVEAEAARALGATRQASAFETLVDILDRPAWGDVIRAGALSGLAALRDERAISHILARMRYGVSTRGRRAAVLALPKLANDRKSREALEDLLDDDNPHLRFDVVSALVDMGDVKSRGALSSRLSREDDGRVRRKIREALRDLDGGPRAETERLREKLEKVEKDYAELAAKVAKLEAVVKSKEA